MRLILVRHGQTSSNVEHLLDTASPGAGLTALGQAQAESLVDVVAHERIDAVFASPLLRAQQTASPLALSRGLDIGIQAGVREIAAGELEMRGDWDAAEAYLGAMARWGSGDLGHRIPSGESGAEFFGRYDRGIAEIVEAVRVPSSDDAGRTAVVVTHGAAMRLWVSVRARNVDVVRLERPMANTGVIVLEGGPGAWDVDTWEGEPVGGATLTTHGDDGPGGQAYPM